MTSKAKHPVTTAAPTYTNFTEAYKVAVRLDSLPLEDHKVIVGFLQDHFNERKITAALER